MTIRKFHTIRDPEVDENFNRLYTNKIESRFKRDGVSGSQTLIKTFQYIETGDGLFSANGSATTERSFPLQERPTTIVYAQACVRDARFLAHVTDITQSSITIACTAWSQTAGRFFSHTTTATVRVEYLVIGSSP